MTGNVITFDALDAAAFPATGQAEVVGTLSANVCIAQMFVEKIGCGSDEIAAFPFTFNGIFLLRVVHR